MNRRAQAVVMLLVGVTVLQTSFTDTYLSFVKPGLRPFLIAAGVLLVATAGMTLWYQWRRDPSHEDGRRMDAAGHRALEAGHRAPEDGQRALEAGHGHSGEPRVAWLLLLPVAVLALVAPQAMGADAAGRSGTALQAPTSDFDPLPEGDPVSIGLQEYASRAVFDSGRSLEKRTVRITGFVLMGDDGTPYLARMIVTCCAADARPIKIGMTGAVPTGLAPDTWLSVTGTYTSQTVKDPVNGGVIPFLDVGEVQQIPRPGNPYQVFVRNSVPASTD